jgi:arylformamidase
MNYKKIIDISWPVSQETTTYKDKKTLVFKKVKKFKENGVRDSDLSLNLHTGTHVDAPAHFIEDGNFIDEVSLSNLIGSCIVLDLTNLEDKISQKDIPDLEQNQIVLFKTKNSFYPTNKRFKKDFIYLDKFAAQKLVDLKIKSVGIDYLGIERDQKNHDTHKILLSKNIPIIEGLFLKNVDAAAAGKYFLICLPINLIETEASPARAVLFCV